MFTKFNNIKKKGGGGGGSRPRAESDLILSTNCGIFGKYGRDDYISIFLINIWKYRIQESNDNINTFLTSY